LGAHTEIRMVGTGLSWDHTAPCGLRTLTGGTGETMQGIEL